MRAAKLVYMMLRPPVALVLMLFAALGLAPAGQADGFHPLFTTVFVIVSGWFINATVLNDLGDEPIDRVNLQNARGRPLVSGDATPRQLLVLGLVAGAISLAVAWGVSPRIGLIVSGGLVLNAMYSLPPFRLCARGALAVIILPLGYVALPFLVGVYMTSSTLSLRTWVLLAGLYVAFIGRIVLKDFRDVVGDETYGKRTFLVRRGRRATLLLSGVCWIAGSATVLTLVPARSLLIPLIALEVACALHGLRLLAHIRDVVEEQVVIGAIAQVGRGMGISLLAFYTMTAKGWTSSTQGLVFGMLGLVFVGTYWVAVTERHQVTAAAVRPF